MVADLFRHAKDIVKFRPGQTIFRQGLPGDAMYLVQEGQVEIRVDGSTVEIVGPGGVIGELALVDGGPRSASAIAWTPCQLARVTASELHGLIQRTPGFARNMMRVIAQRLRRMNAIIVDDEI